MIGHIQWARSQGECVLSKISSTGYQRYSSNWGGDELRAQSAYSFHGVRADLTQASIGSSCSTARALIEWVGLGGDQTDSLIQTGTLALGPWFGADAGYYSFWEFIDASTSYDSGTVVMGVQPRVGDHVYEYLELHGTGPSRYAFVEVYDVTTGYADYTNVTIGSTALTDSAEYIDERPYVVDYGFTDIPNYGWTSWYNMRVLRSNSSSWTGAYSEPTEWWIMMTSDGNVYPRNGNRELSQTTGTYSDNHMQDHWHNCH